MPAVCFACTRYIDPNLPAPIKPTRSARFSAARAASIRCRFIPTGSLQDVAGEVLVAGDVLRPFFHLGAVTGELPAVLLLGLKEGPSSSRSITVYRRRAP